MLKTKYMVASFVLLVVIFLLVISLLPSADIEKTVKTDTTYEETVFDKSKVTTVEITVPESDLASILENPSDEKMVGADITINGKTVKDVGFRTKGNMTLSSVASMEDSDRYSFKVDFDQYQGTKNLDGLKKLNLNNGYTDSTYMREYLSYELMEQMGIATPAHSYMNVTINGKNWGLYLGVEAIEETFLQSHFTFSTGDLYKPDGTGADLSYISDDIADYPGINLMTNEDTSNQSSWIKMVDTINNGGNLEEVLNVDEMLRYFATNTALVNLDHYQGSMLHNYYLYEEDGKFSMLPWDYNMAFGGFSAGGEMPPGADPTNTKDNADLKAAKADPKVGGGMPMGNMGSQNSSDTFISDSNINFSITEPVSGATLEDRPLLNALLSNDEYVETFNNYLNEIATTFFSEESMTEMTSEIADLITPYVEKDPTKFYTTEDFLEGVSGDNSLVSFATKRADSILAQLSGDLVVKAETSSSMKGGNAPGNAKGNRPQPPGGMEMPEGMQIPEGMKMPGGMQMPGQGGVTGSGYSKQTLIVTAILFVLLIAATTFAYSFPRRRFFKK